MSESRGGRFHELWNMQGRVTAYVRSRGADRLTAEEVVAETYVVALRRLADVPADDASALRWLLGVASRALANARRSARRSLVLADRLGRQRPLAHVVDGGERRMAAEVWLALRPEERLVLELVLLHGLNLDELATILHCSRSAAAKRLSRARVRLTDLHSA